jgi:serine/threonine protein kinase
MSQPPAACPTEDAILAYVEGTTPGQDRETIDSHLGDCAACRQLVSALARGETEGSGTPAPSGPGRSAADLAPGSVVAGKYEVLEVLGRGGMGVVLLAFHRTLRQRVALKFLLGEHARDANLVSRFFREARAAAALGSDHVVRVLDADRDPRTGEPFVALEYLDGRDLSRVLREDGPLPITTAVDCALQAAEALALAHRHAIVHRDVKPANLFLARQPDGSLRLKVLDFGIAKMASVVASASQATDHTGPAMVLGSPRYMAPEQLKDSSTVDERADIWALGVTLFELVSGASPFGGTSLIELCASIATDPPKSLRELRPDVPPALEAAIFRCLEKDRDARTSSMGDLATDLAPFASPEGVRAADRARRVEGARPSSRPPAPSSGAVGSKTPAPLGEDSTIRATSSVTQSATGPRTTWAAVITLALVGTGAAAWWFAAGRSAPVATPSSLASDHEAAPVVEPAVPNTDDAKPATSPLPADAQSPAGSASAAPSSAAPATSSASTAPAARRAPSSPAPASPPRSDAGTSKRTPPPSPPTPAAPPGTSGLHRDGLTDRK